MQRELLLSESCRNAEFIATGKELPKKITLDVPVTDMSPEARALLLKYPAFFNHRGTGLEVDTIPETPAQWEALLQQYHGSRLTVIEEERTRVLARLNEMVDKYCALDWSQQFSTQAIALALSSSEKALCKDTPQLEDYSAVFAEAEARVKANVEARKAENEARKAVEQAGREAKDQADQEDRVAWIAAHGSSHLRRATTAGYACTRLYITERAALELPGYVVDFARMALEEKRNCPSVMALDEAERVTQAGMPADIIWLRRPPAATQQEAQDDDREPCEAVAVDYHGCTAYFCL